MIICNPDDEIGVKTTSRQTLFDPSQISGLTPITDLRFQEPFDLF